MSAEMFDILMVATLGSSAGAGAGLIIGYMTHHQKNDWKCYVHTRENHQLCTGLILLCTILWGIGILFPGKTIIYIRF